MMLSRTLSAIFIPAIVLIGVVFIISANVGRSSRVVYSVPSATDKASSSDTGVYLPMVRFDCIGKCWSGVHLGNRNFSDWSLTLLQRMDARLGGEWPVLVVALSNQVYQIHRYSSSHPTYPCRIYGAGVRNPVLFDFIKRASQARVRVVIRLMPSPGNFPDWNDPNWPIHRLSPGPPVGPNGYCDWSNYRSPGDLGDEMGRIQALNWSQGFLVFGFEPANEPNVEWYSRNVGTPRIWNSTAWTDMDAYFSSIYDYVHASYPAYIRVLTPPMGQSQYAEGNDIEDVGDLTPCEDVWLVDDVYRGYDLMRTTYETKSDGISWHNYWSQGKELYNYCPSGQHVSIYFPQWMKDAIRNQGIPVVITEADLGSPLQMRGLDPLPDKRTGNNPAYAADSIRHFFSSEHRFGGQYHYRVLPGVASWLLADDTGFGDHDWHKAYEESGFEHLWYRLWFLGEE
jgi:hypothetical protein